MAAKSEEDLKRITKVEFEKLGRRMDGVASSTALRTFENDTSIKDTPAYLRFARRSHRAGSAPARSDTEQPIEQAHAEETGDEHDEA